MEQPPPGSLGGVLAEIHLKRRKRCGRGGGERRVAAHPHDAVPHCPAILISIGSAISIYEAALL